MSGIVGIVSTRNTVPGLLHSLQRMEEPGHNSCGLVVHGLQGQTNSPARLHRHRRAQRASAWIEQMAQSEKPALNGLQGMIGMGHCGQNPTTGSHALHNVLPQMSHGPNSHLNSPARVAVVMHGQTQATPLLLEAMIERDYSFKSQSASELVAHLIDATYQSDPVQAVRRVLGLLHGPLAMGVMFKGEPQKMFVVQRDKKLYWGSGPTHIAWASTTDALPKDTIDLTPLCAAQVLEIHSSETIISHCLHT